MHSYVCCHGNHKQGKVGYLVCEQTRWVETLKGGGR